MEILLSIDSMENREGFIWFDGELIEWTLWDEDGNVEGHSKL